MRVLITGGAGFIGSHLAEKHLNNGNEVYIIDDLSTGSFENVQHLKEQTNFRYYIDTINNYHLTAELVDLCDIVYHLAAAVGVRLIIESPVRTIETNLRGTEIVLSLAEKKGNGFSSLPLQRYMVSATQCHFVKTTTSFLDQLVKDDGVMLARRQLTNF